MSNPTPDDQQVDEFLDVPLVPYGTPTDPLDNPSHSAHHASLHGAVLELDAALSGGAGWNDGTASIAAGDGILATGTVLSADIDGTTIIYSTATSPDKKLKVGTIQSSQVVGLDTALDSKADKSTVVTAGMGLTGDATLAGPISLAVGPGPGIAVSFDTVEVDRLITDSWYAFRSRQIVSGPGLVGGGDLSADRTLVVGQGTGIIVYPPTDPGGSRVEADTTYLNTNYLRKANDTATGPLSMGGYKITDLTSADIMNSNDAAPVWFVNQLATGVDPHVAVVAATLLTDTIDPAVGLQAGQTVDGYTPVAGDRILVRNQGGTALPAVGLGKKNGIYDVPASGPWVRSGDADGEEELRPGSAVFVSKGTTLSGAVFICQMYEAQLPWTPGTDDNFWHQYSSRLELIPGTGLTLTGNVLDANVGAGLAASSDEIYVPIGGITTELLADGSVTNAKVAADIGSLNDVDTTIPPTDTQVLTWQTDAWRPADTLMAEVFVQPDQPPLTGSGSIWVNPYDITQPGGPNQVPIDWLSDVDTDSAPPSTGDTLVWNGTNWVPGAQTLDALTDVNTTTPPPQTGFALRWNGTTWVPAVVSMDSLSDVDTTTAPPVSGNLLKWNGTNWVPGPAPVLDHGGLTGLGDDDHPQYLNNARGDARYVNVTGDTVTGNIKFVDSAVQLSDTTVAHRNIEWSVADKLRWTMGKTNAAESGGNAGTGFNISAWDDAGGFLGTALSFTRSTQLATVKGNPTDVLGIAPKQYVDGKLPTATAVIRVGTAATAPAAGGLADGSLYFGHA